MWKEKLQCKYMIALISALTTCVSAVGALTLSHSQATQNSNGKEEYGKKYGTAAIVVSKASHLKTKKFWSSIYKTTALIIPNYHNELFTKANQNVLYNYIIYIHIKPKINKCEKKQHQKLTRQFGQPPVWTTVTAVVEAGAI